MKHPRTVIIVGGGRAGGSIAIAARDAGLDVRIVPGPSGRAPAGFENARVPREESLPPADLVILAVSDGAIAEVAAGILTRLRGRPIVAHLSGLTSIRHLSVLADAGLPVGSLHPLMTLPDPDRGAAALAGASAAITGEDGVVAALSSFAEALGMRPFVLADEDKPLYHAAASAASNFVTTVLGLAQDLAVAAGVAPSSFRPLAEAAVAAVFEAGAAVALTGPVARGDWGTVHAQLTAVEGVSTGIARDFRALVEVTAHRAGRLDEFRAVVESD